MDLGFETVGNATLIVHDYRPILVTDPWVVGPAYFGSWGLSHQIPEEQVAAIHAAKWVWFSHGHPDHLNPSSLPLFKDKRILLADHVGGRIASDLRRGGYEVTVLRDNFWTSLSPRVRVRCLADYNQDSILLVDVDGRLLVNLNDCNERGWGSSVRRLIRDAPVSFIMRLSGYGDADMINFLAEDGSRLVTTSELRQASGYQVGAENARMTDTFGARYFVPFSSFHRYQRSDSVWANGCTTPIAAMEEGYQSSRSEALPAFVRFDFGRDHLTPLNPPTQDAKVYLPHDFGDNWSDELGSDEVVQVERYFASVAHLTTFLEFVNVRVGGRDHVIPLGGEIGRGVTFEVPRHSLMQAVKHQVFDDLLIGNFMRTMLHGRWPVSRLSAEFTPYVAKYADNGQARSTDEVHEYFEQYRTRMGTTRYIRHLVERQAKSAIRARFDSDAFLMSLANRAYQRIAARS